MNLIDAIAARIIRTEDWIADRIASTSPTPVFYGAVVVAVLAAGVLLFAIGPLTAFLDLVGLSAAALVLCLALRHMRLHINTDWIKVSIWGLVAAAAATGIAGYALNPTSCAVVVVSFVLGMAVLTARVARRTPQI